MFESLYANVGGKIKNWAVWIFIVEALCAVIGGLIIIFQGEEFIITGLLIIAFGPVFAWISSWLLYAFGELVEKTCMNEENTRAIAERMYKNDSDMSNPFFAAVGGTVAEEKAQPAQHKWLCHHCGTMRSKTPCERCGKE